MKLLHCIPFLFIPMAVQAQPTLKPTAILSQLSNKCIDVFGSSTADGAAVVQWSCNGGSNQNWTLRPNGGFYQVVAEHSGKCLSNSSNSSGSALVQMSCSASNAQLWTAAVTGQQFTMISRGSGNCMAVNDGSNPADTTVIQAVCTPAANEVFKFNVGENAVSMKATHSGKCASIGGTGGTPIVQTVCTDAPEQQWKLRQSQTRFQVISQGSGLCLQEPVTTTRTGGASVLQGTCKGAINELWNMEQVNNTYRLRSRASNLCLNIYGAAPADQTKLITYPCGTAPNELFSIAPSGGFTTPVEPTLGKWSSIINLSIVPVAAAALPNGKLLLWSSRDRFSFGPGGIYNSTYTSIFDPATRTATEMLVTDTGHDMFCPGTTNMADGSILVNGGSTNEKTSIYNPFNNSWAAAANMNIPRAYQGNALLSNGDVFTLGGSWSGGLGNKDGEVFSTSGGWRRLPAVLASSIETASDPEGVYRSDNHAWLFASDNGQVFHAGPSANMNWITTAGNGSIQPAGNRADDPYSMNGNAAMYDIGKILKVGGAPAYQGTSATTNAYVIDINSGVKVTKVAPMAFPRAFHSSVVLPTGEVVVIGGQAYPVAFSDNASQLAAELWNPLAGTFTTLTSMQTPRNYHSVALLMPDATIFVGGGGLCGSCSTNHPNAEIFTPPYLLKPDGSLQPRPIIMAAPTTMNAGDIASVTTDKPVTSFALVRMSSITHTVNNDQRRIPLAFSTSEANTFNLTIPANRGIAIPGYYMLFAMDSSGVPSIARIVQIP